MSDEFLNEWEKYWGSYYSQFFADAWGHEAGDVECKLGSSSTAGSSVGAGEGSSVGAGSSSAGEPTGAGEGNCIADAIYGASPAFSDAIEACFSTTVVETTITYDYSACPLSRLTEACTADNRKLHCR